MSLTPIMNPHLNLALKVVVTLALLWFLIDRADISSVAKQLANTSPMWALLGFALGIPSMVASGIRWRQISAYLRVQLPWAFAILSYMEGIAFNLLIPGSLGGDAVRLSKVTRARGRLRQNLAAVLFDRAAGMAILLAMALPLMAFQPLGQASGKITLLVTSMASLAVVGSLGIYTASRYHRMRRYRILREVSHVAILYGAVFFRVDRLAKIGFWSLVAQSLVVAMLAVCCKAVDVTDLNVAQMTIATLLALFATAMPFTIGGLGLREGSIFWILTTYGVADAQALSAAALFGVVLLAQSLPGLGIWAFGLARLERVVEPARQTTTGALKANGQ